MTSSIQSTGPCGWLLLPKDKGWGLGCVWGFLFASYTIKLIFIVLSSNPLHLKSLAKLSSSIDLK